MAESGDESAAHLGVCERARAAARHGGERTAAARASGKSTAAVRVEACGCGAGRGEEPEEQRTWRAGEACCCRSRGGRERVRMALLVAVVSWLLGLKRGRCCLLLLLRVRSVSRGGERTEGLAVCVQRTVAADSAEDCVRLCLLLLLLGV